MAAPSFSALEVSLAGTVMDRFENIRLSDGVDVFGAVLDRAVEFVGEYGLTGERRDRITLRRTDAVGFARGGAIQADPGTYSAAELAAMERTSWTLDRMDFDDGQLVSWWLK